MTEIQIEKEILEKVSSFKEYAQINRLSIGEGIYSYLTDFGIFLRDAISNNEKITVEQSFNLLNTWFSSNDIDLENKITVGILEVLTDTEKAQSTCFNNLNQRGIEVFNKLFDRFTKL